MGGDIIVIIYSNNDKYVTVIAESEEQFNQLEDNEQVDKNEFKVDIDDLVFEL